MTSPASVSEVAQSTAAQRLRDPLWREISDTLFDFKQLAALASRTSNCRPDGKIPGDLEKRLFGAMDALMRLLQARLGPLAECDGRGREIGRWVHAELLPFILLGRFSHRAYAKPFGYAGDFETISLVYRNEPDGVGGLGVLIDRYCLSVPPAIAVRNRRPLMVAEMKRQLASTQPARVSFRVTSLACGPACEMVDLFESCPTGGAILATLVDAPIIRP